MRDDEHVAGRDELDARIDAVLRSYAEPPEATEPRVALARIMERARVERPTRWWTWGLAGAAACLIAVMVAMWAMRMPRPPEIARVPPAPGVVKAPDRPAPTAIAKVKAPVGRQTMHAGHSFVHRELAASRTSLPKLDVFPTPTPLSPQEQALVAFATHGPPEVQRAVLKDQQHWDDPIIVAELQEKSPQPRSQQDQ